MQLTAENRNVSVAGMQDAREFRIKPGAHMMAILSGLYQNPIDAMVREYTTNMMDGTRALKRKNPNITIKSPEIHLPTTLNPVLVFKDYGVGMDFDTVWNVYTVYGDSTKTSTNDDAGGFGIGSKTAFCYNNGQQWTIESRYNGELMIFMAFVDNSGMPTLTHVTTVPTNESNGITIKIPILREHIDAVSVAARKYVPYSEFPIVVLNTRSEILPQTYLHSGSNWGIFKPTNTNHWQVTQKHNVIIGCVPYPLDIVQAGVSNMALLRFNSIDVTLPIGSVDIVPSRDGLKYTDRTKNTIKNVLNDIVREIATYVENKIDSAATLYDAYKIFDNLNTIAGLQEIVPTVKYKGVKFEQKGIVTPVDEILKLDSTAVITSYGITSNRRSTVDLIDNPMPVRYNHNVLVMIDDMQIGGVGVAKSYIREKWVARDVHGKISRYGHTLGQVILVKANVTPAQISSLFGDMPQNTIMSTQDMSGKVKITRNVGNTNLYLYDNGSWAARAMTPSGVNYYVPLTKNLRSRRWEYPVSNMRYGLDGVIEMLSSIGFTVNKLYGIRSEEVSKFDSTLWIDINTIIDSKIKDYLKVNQDAYFMYLQYIHLPLPVSNLYTKIHKFTDAIEKHTDIKTFVDVVGTIIKSQADHGTITYSRYTDSVFSKITKYLKVSETEEYNKLLKLYPNTPSVERLTSTLYQKWPLLEVITAPHMYGYDGKINNKISEYLLKWLDK